MNYDAQKVTYQEVTIFDRPALFTECRVDRATVPEGVYRYELRHGDEDWGEPVSLSRSIVVNYYGTILTREPFQLPVEGWIPLEPDSLSFRDDGCHTLSTFQEKYPASEKDVIDFYSVNDPSLHDLYFSRSEEQDKTVACSITGMMLLSRNAALWSRSQRMQHGLPQSSRPPMSGSA